MTKIPETELGLSDEYQTFRSCVPLKRIDVGSNPEDLKTWIMFDCGPKKNRRPPLIFIPPVSGTADIFYFQMLSLSARGYRVISVQWPPYWSILEWCAGFKELLDTLEFEKVHLFGSALGGFLAQKFTEYTHPCPRVASLILCNSFTDTSVFDFGDEASVFWLIPLGLLKSMILEGFKSESRDYLIHRSIDFMIEKLDSLSKNDLASRLSLNCAPSYVSPQKVNDLPVTVIDSWDESALCHEVKEEVYKCYPDARLAHLKTGGNFPFLSRNDEVNLHIIIHLRKFESAV